MLGDLLWMNEFGLFFIISLRVKLPLSIILKTCLRATEIQRKFAPSKFDKGTLKGSTIGRIANHSVFGSIPIAEEVQSWDQFLRASRIL